MYDDSPKNSTANGIVGSSLAAQVRQSELKGWERKVIMLHDVVSDDMDIVLEPHRDWMLGGEHMEWRYHKDNLTGDIILERR